MYELPSSNRGRKRDKRNHYRAEPNQKKKTNKKKKSWKESRKNPLSVAVSIFIKHTSMRHNGTTQEDVNRHLEFLERHSDEFEDNKALTIINDKRNQRKSCRIGQGRLSIGWIHGLMIAVIQLVWFDTSDGFMAFYQCVYQSPISWKCETWVTSQIYHSTDLKAEGQRQSLGKKMKERDTEKPRYLKQLSDENELKPHWICKEFSKQ